MMNRRKAARIALTCCVAPMLLAADGISDVAKARQIMSEIVDALQIVLPLSLSEDRFLDSDNHDRILAALGELSRNAGRLRRHGSTKDAGFAHLSDSLARDAEAIELRFAGQRAAEARFLLHHITENCVACHSRLPDPIPHPLGERLLVDPAVASLPPHERVTLEVATRQFERALATYESILAEPDSIGSMDLDGLFEGYFEVSLRVSEDPERAIAHLEKLAKRPDLPERLRSDVSTWIGTLESLRMPSEGTPIEQARRLMGPLTPKHSLSDREALVRLIAASGILNRYVASQQESPRTLAEAYYLLGVIESRIGRTFWASQTEDFLEASIRADPAGPFASDAFALLEEFVVSGYTGSSGTNIPEDIAEHMDVLQHLMAGGDESDH